MAKSKTRLFPVLIAVICLILVGTIFFSILENWTPLDAFYFSVATMSTVGYGDLYPKTAAGKLFTSFFILVGVGIMLYAFAVVANHFFGKRTGSTEFEK